MMKLTNLPLSWICCPEEEGILALAKGIYRYLFNPTYRINAKIRRISFSTGRKAKRLSGSLLSKHSVVVSPDAKIGAGVSFPHPIGLVLGEGSAIGDGSTIYQNVTLGQNRGKYPVLGCNVIVYAGAKIIGDVFVGDNAVVGANSVVINDVPANSVVAGSPARTIRYRSPSGDRNLY